MNIAPCCLAGVKGKVCEMSQCLIVGITSDLTDGQIEAVLLEFDRMEKVTGNCADSVPRDFVNDEESDKIKAKIPGYSGEKEI